MVVFLKILCGNKERCGGGGLVLLAPRKPFKFKASQLSLSNINASSLARKIPIAISQLSKMKIENGTQQHSSILVAS